ncbi:MAG: hydrolase, partial [Variovorax sp.]|nr:hydrolase [Variovorax sp.]
MQINYTRRGKGKPLLLIHGLGGSWQSWRPVLDALMAERSVVAIDLPGFGKSPPLAGRVTLDGLAEAVAGFLHMRNLSGIDAVGSSLGARLVLELARRGGVLGAVVALSPSGFWTGLHRHSYLGAVW